MAPTRQAKPTKQAKPEEREKATKPTTQAKPATRAKQAKATKQTRATKAAKASKTANQTKAPARAKPTPRATPVTRPATAAVRTAAPDAQAEPARAFESGAAWRAWLASNHASAPVLWVKFAKKESRIASVTHAEGIDEALCFGWIDSQARTLDDDYWMLRFTPRGPRSKWSQINCAKVEALTASGRMTPAGAREIARAKADGRWQAAYAGPRTAQVPEDLQVELDKHRGAQAFFASLESRNRYAILYRIHDAKTPETRARRIEKFMAMLKAGEKIYP